MMCVTNPVRKRNAMKARNDAARIHSLVQRKPRVTAMYRARNSDVCRVAKRRETEMRISDSVD